MTTRRSVLKALSLSGVSVATGFAQAKAEALPPEERAARAWREFCEALEDIVPADCRIQVFGSHKHGRQTPVFRIEGHRTVVEEIGVTTMTVDRLACNYIVREDGWKDDLY